MRLQGPEVSEGMGDGIGGFRVVWGLGFRGFRDSFVHWTLEVGWLLDMCRLGHLVVMSAAWRFGGLGNRRPAD